MPAYHDRDKKDCNVAGVYPGYPPQIALLILNKTPRLWRYASRTSLPAPLEGQQGIDISMLVILAP